jgi:cbb3-type cytochrome oxidase subunit 3
MESSATALFTISLGGVFAAVIITMLVSAKRKKASTDRQLDTGRTLPDGATDGT